MRAVNIHEAKTQLSRLVEAAARGEGFVIAKAGRPMVKVAAVDAPARRAVSVSLPAKSPCPRTSTVWARRRSEMSTANSVGGVGQPERALGAAS
jgi:antitoxin (DNA-binding transcriptional repressor) of toxin-antitoxin stability system